VSSSTVRIGFIGTGGIARAHLGRLKDIPEAEVVALCDVDQERVEAAAEPFGAAVYTDGGRLLDSEKLDALYVCVPPHAHEDFELRAAAKGVHLFVEKPVSLYMEQALAVQKAIREAGILSQAGYSLRYFPAYVRLHDFLAGKEIGTAHVFRWNGLVGAPWWRRYDQSGGQLVEMTTHQVDMLRWCMGEVEAVSASYSFDRLLKDEEGVTIPDTQAILLRFRSGASATISTSCAIGGAWQGGLDFALKNGKVSLQGEEIKVAPDGAYEVPPPGEPGPGIDEAFVRAVATKDASLLRSPYDDAVKTLAVTLAANRSAEQGGRLVPISELLPE
jgi:predicted dehydrogenase